MESKLAKLIQDAENVILNRSNPNWEKDVRIAMSRVYRFLKGKLFFFRRNVKLLIKVLELECLMENYYLPIDTSPDFDPNKILELPSEIKTMDDVIKSLKCIVHNGRAELNKNEDVLNDSLSQKCIISSTYIEKYCRENNIRCRKYSCTYDLMPGSFHSFCIVKFKLPNGEVKNYLVDCTYRQFFTYRNSFLERCGLVGFAGCCMGRYMLMNDSRRCTAEKLLKHGFIEMTPENIKNYFDGFILQGRNGKYYDRLGKDFIDEDDYTTGYSHIDYLNALMGVRPLNETYLDILYNRILHSDIVFDYNLIDEKEKIRKSFFRR